MAGGPVRQPNAGVIFIPQSGIYEFGYCKPALKLDFTAHYLMKSLSEPNTAVVARRRKGKDDREQNTLAPLIEIHAHHARTRVWTLSMAVRVRKLCKNTSGYSPRGPVHMCFCHMNDCSVNALTVIFYNVERQLSKSPSRKTIDSRNNSVKCECACYVCHRKFAFPIV